MRLRNPPLDPYELELPEETLDPYANVEVSYHAPRLYGFHSPCHEVTRVCVTMADAHGSLRTCRFLREADQLKECPSEGGVAREQGFGRALN